MKGFRTIFFNAGIAAATAAIAHFSPETIRELAGPHYATAAVGVFTLINVLLRLNTNTPVGKAA